ncbi:MAG: DNA-directed RNA polymerase subunit beta' [Candidatus Marinimicrobia bacterium]|nr:DNA-directed RNA polymerase subunit beta' [Candidatus Neomarinimicrobiota bacterium]
MKPRQATFKENFKEIQISLASPDSILARSYGEILKPETINYRTYKPEKDGLFCEKIFGPVKDWECHCGKYKRPRYKGIICDRCGVEITRKKVRRERMGHITLAVPIVHIWYLRSIPSKISYVLGMSVKLLEKIVYYENYVVLDPGTTELEKNQLLSEDELNELEEEIGEETLYGDNPLVVDTGGDAIGKMLASLEIPELILDLRDKVENETSVQRKLEALKRLRVVKSFEEREGKKLNKAEWMVMGIIPVIPPELRPLVPLDGGRFATSDLNDLYRRVIIRNNRLKQLMEIRAPEVILRNEKRMLQEAVDSLFDNSRRRTAVRSGTRRLLKSLSDMLKGKQGRFRQNLLGKRVDYSGRSVIVVGPDLQLHQCGLPKEMAIELFKPFIINKLIERGYQRTVKGAKKMVERKDSQIWDVLEEVIEDHPVLLNRAPTLHRLGIQAFQPVLVEGRAIRIHPLVCAAFNADFDGDQMAVHIPLSIEAQLEARVLMLASHNILSPAHGMPIALPSQDMVLGCYYLTKSLPGAKGEGMTFSSPSEAKIAYDHGLITLHTDIIVRRNGEMINTTVGRVIFNDIVPKELEYVNRVVTKKYLEKIVGEAFRISGNYETVTFLDGLKKLGFEHATLSGISFGLGDVVIPPEKQELVEEAHKQVKQVIAQYEAEIITDGERYNKVIDIWTSTSLKIGDAMMKHLEEADNGFNPVYMMSDSGARGNREQIRQLAGMRGLMAKPQKSLTGGTGEIIENPITSNFKEGLTVLEYFISTHGARKGLADTALKTADAGYLTRRLVDVAQDVVILLEDCGTIRGISISALKEGEEVKELLKDRVLGRVALDDVHDPITEEFIVGAGTEIDEAVADVIENSAVESIAIRSALTCEAKRGICAKCYGRNLTTGKMIFNGEAVGIMAAQSIGEPGTQLTLRTFHVGGAASVIAAKTEMHAKVGGYLKYDKKFKVTPKRAGGRIALTRNSKLHIVNKNGQNIVNYNVPYGATVLKDDGEKIEQDEVIFKWDPDVDVIIAQEDGIIKFVDIEEGQTLREEADEAGRKQRFIIESRDKKLTPKIEIISKRKKSETSARIPVRSQLMVSEGKKVKQGDILIKKRRESRKAGDITGGLPRVAELFEARQPKEPAVVSEIDGIVGYGKLRRGVQEIIVKGSEEEEEKKYSVPYGKHVLVHPGDTVEAGEALSEGSIAPQDILNILGPGKVQEYLVDEIQAVYRFQDVRINDKHIEVIVRQMMQKVEVKDPGDTDYLEGDRISKTYFLDENNRIEGLVVVTDSGDSKINPGELLEKERFKQTNERLKKVDKKPMKSRTTNQATSKPLLLGITRASLNTESFISAASFQETTRVLTDAAVASKVDPLRGLKENVIMGRLIPAGTGSIISKNLILKVDDDEETGVSEQVSEMEEREAASVAEKTV